MSGLPRFPQQTCSVCSATRSGDGGDNITLRYQSKLRHLRVGRRYAGTRVMLLVADHDVHVLTEDGEPLAEFTTNPTKDYRPKKRPEPN